MYIHTYVHTRIYLSLVRSNNRQNSFLHISSVLQGPKLEIFGSGVFALIRPVWILTR